MNTSRELSAQIVLRDTLYKTLAGPKPFSSGSQQLSNQQRLDHFLMQLSQFHHRSAHSIIDIKNRDNKKSHGDIFEYFSKLYMILVLGIETVWLLNDVPEHILQILRLKRQDVGIDLIGIDSLGRYYACQAKYKDRANTIAPSTSRAQRSGARKVSVTWREISTFFALTSRTGPFHKIIVITTADYVRHMAPKTPKDISVCLGTLRKLSHEQWTKMYNMQCSLMEGSLMQSIANVQSATRNAPEPMMDVWETHDHLIHDQSSVHDQKYLSESSAQQQISEHVTAMAEATIASATMASATGLIDQNQSPCTYTTNRPHILYFENIPWDDELEDLGATIPETPVQIIATNPENCQQHINPEIISIREARRIYFEKNAKLRNANGLGTE